MDRTLQTIHMAEQGPRSSSCIVDNDDKLKPVILYTNGMKYRITKVRSR